MVRKGRKCHFNASLRKLEDQSIAHAFQIAPQRFVPHIIIGRQIIFKKDFQIQSLEQRVQQIERVVSKIELIESKFTEGKLIYSVIETSELN